MRRPTKAHLVVARPISHNNQEITMPRPKLPPSPAGLTYNIKYRINGCLFRRQAMTKTEAYMRAAQLMANGITPVTIMVQK